MDYTTENWHFSGDMSMKTTSEESRETQVTVSESWYDKSGAGNHQGLIISESDGRNVAVAYDKKDAPLIAAAPELLSALAGILDLAYEGQRNRESDMRDSVEGSEDAAHAGMAAIQAAESAIAKATGENRT
jgi:hypothetical protein